MSRVLCQRVLTTLACWSVVAFASISQAQTLDVTPTDGSIFKFSGFEGGPFAPETLSSWQLDDLDNTVLDYSVSSNQPWLTFSPTLGVIVGVATPTVNAVLETSEAENLAPGNYTAVVTFRNLTNDAETTMRTVELEVLASNFTVSPTLVNLAVDEGAASPNSTHVTLTNSGGQDLNYALEWISKSWLDINKTGGTVPGTSADTFIISYSTIALSKGTYNAEIKVVNTTNGRGTTRVLVTLVVSDPQSGPILILSPIAEGGEIEVQPPGAVISSAAESVVRILFAQGQVITLKVNVDDGYEFVEWGGDLPLLEDDNENPITLTMDGTRSITAIVVQRVWPLHLSTSGGGSGTLKSTPIGDNSNNALVSEYDDGTEVELEATPDDGSVFTGWAGNVPEGESKSNPLTIDMDRERTITARFEQVVDVNVDITGEGVVTIDPDLETYFLGAAITLKASPAEGYYLGEWTGSVSSDQEEIALVLDGDLDVTAKFIEGVKPSTAAGDGEGDTGNPKPVEGTTFQLTSAVEGNGVVTPASGKFDAGSTLRLVATPDVGWVFVGWEGDASGADLATSVVLENNKNIVARFEQDPDAASDASSATAPMCGMAGAAALPFMVLGIWLTSPRRRRRMFQKGC